MDVVQTVYEVAVMAQPKGFTHNNSGARSEQQEHDEHFQEATLKSTQPKGAAQTAEEFAKNTPEFWIIAINQGRPAPGCERIFKFAEAYAASRFSRSGLSLAINQELADLREKWNAANRELDTLRSEREQAHRQSKSDLGGKSLMSQEMAESWLDNHEPTWAEVIELADWGASQVKGREQAALTPEWICEYHRSYGQRYVNTCIECLAGTRALSERGASAVPSPARGIGTLVEKVRDLLNDYEGCTEIDCGCPGSLLARAVEEGEKQIKGVPSPAAKPLIQGDSDEGDSGIGLAGFDESESPAATPLCPHNTTVGMCELCERVAESPVPSPVGSVYEVPADCRPFCTVCASAMIPTGYKCYSCGSQTGFPSESPVPSEAAPEAIVEPWMRGKAKSYLAEWSARYRTHRELAKVEWDGAQLEYHLANFLARNREAAQPSEAVSDNELIALADEIERTAFFREIDVMETDISALKRAISNLVRSKVFKREAVSQKEVMPNANSVRSTDVTGAASAQTRNGEAVSSTAAPEMPQDLLSDLSLEIANEYEFDGDTSLAVIDEALRKAFKAGAGTAAPEEKK